MVYLENFAVTLAIAIFVVALAVTRPSWQQFLRQYRSPIVKYIYLIMRVFLPLAVCLLAWLCVKQAIEFQHLKRYLIQILAEYPQFPLLMNPPKSRILGFLWQYPVVLSFFPVCTAAATVLYQFFSKARLRVLMSAVAALVILLVQGLYIAPAVAAPARDLCAKLQTL